MDLIIMGAAFLALLAAGIPIAFCLGLSCALYGFLSGIPFIFLAQKMYGGLNSFTLLCIPGFVLAGELMNAGGISERIVRFCNSFIGHFRGGLAQANIVASMIFAGISGSALADTVSLGSVLIPSMKKEGYDVEFSCAVTASSSTIGPIIPPSTPMIIVGTLTGLSVGKLFMAGVVPGVLMGVGQMALTYYLSRKRNYPKGEKATWKERLVEFKYAFWSLLMTFIILYGILGGLFSPTEASIVACLYGLLVGVFIYRDLTLRNLPRIFINAAITTTGIMVLVGFANCFAWIMMSERVPMMITKLMLSLTENRYLILLFINILLLVVGMFMETIAALLTLFPTLLMVAVSVGVDPIHFGLIVVLNLVIGLTTPPVGVCMFVASSIGKISLSAFTKANLPYLTLNIGILMLLTYFPSLVLWLPGLVM
ncbi:MAG: TRAP transporter large permease [Planctomycetota bacterium]|nr:TRAP transporter large permease [Planctomycetota bacterium]